jgi:hypothetical protein
MPDEVERPTSWFLDAAKGWNDRFFDEGSAQIKWLPVKQAGSAIR